MQERILRGGRSAALQFVVCTAFLVHHDAHAESATIGNAVLVIGQACAQRAQTFCTPLAKGASIEQGDTVETGKDGYVYITTVDHGFISVRPNSSLTFERYEYNPADPRKTVIKLSLTRGMVREISGTGAQAARDHYRMNTPVAALGVRGTDFTVFTDENVTRADVLSGGIVMTPLGADCSATGVGPCEGSAAAQLFAGKPNEWLQVYRGSARPVVIDSGPSRVMSEQAVAELKSEESSARAATAQAPVSPGVAPAELTFSPTTPAPAPAPTPAPAPAADPVTPAAPAVPVVVPEPEAQIFWGRYKSLGSYGADTTLTALVQQGSEQVPLPGTGPFAMTRAPQTEMVMPTSGLFKFGLQAAQAFVVNATTGAATEAQISSPLLSIDFGTHAFQTSMSLSANSTSYAISGSGSVTPDGKLVSEWGVSRALVRGVLAGKNATQAGYLFQQSLGGSSTAYGATQWSR
ncbi:FecR family protein [Paraburkholderia youngii]|uniref:FecR family protein n=1 Tax=Paraburkholderia youngii TaxID=2782701 RepID=UPI003D19F40F